MRPVKALKRGKYGSYVARWFAAKASRCGLVWTTNHSRFIDDVLQAVFPGVSLDEYLFRHLGAQAGLWDDGWTFLMSWEDTPHRIGQISFHVIWPHLPRLA